MVRPGKANRLLVSLSQAHSEVCVQSFLGFTSENYDAWTQAGPGQWASATNWPWFPGYPTIAILRTEYLNFSKQRVCD